MSLVFCSDFSMLNIWMHPVHAGYVGLTAWEAFSLHTVGTWKKWSFKYCDVSSCPGSTHALVYFYPSSVDHFQQDKGPCVTNQNKYWWNCSGDCRHESFVLKWTSRSLHHNATEYVLDLVEMDIRILDLQPGNLKKFEMIFL